MLYPMFFLVSIFFGNLLFWTVDLTNLEKILLFFSIQFSMFAVLIWSIFYFIFQKMNINVITKKGDE